MSDIPKLLIDDPWLEPYTQEVKWRREYYRTTLNQIRKQYGALKEYADRHQYYGLHYSKEEKGFYFREWAPSAHEIYLIGDFNDWDRKSHPLKKIDNGNWEIFLSDKEVGKKLTHQSKYKMHVIANNGALDRIPAYVRRVIQDEESKSFSAQVWKPKKEYEWKDEKFKALSAAKQPFIYEAHIGIATEEERIGSYKEFADKIIPRIQKLGYNCVQFMAIQEHPYYGSFGYHVSNYFAPTSRFGTPEDFKYLVDSAHQAGIAVIIDLVHSHSVKNRDEGLNELDGTDYQYFHEGPKGYHEQWDSRLFDYGKEEVRRFLLSNVRYWLEEFHVDGFRYDGVTSMMYWHHGNYFTFDHYGKYFKIQVDNDNLLYLQLANTLTKEIKPSSLSVAEDMSGMPGLCRTPEDGGIGFDFRLGMGLPDFWIRYLKHLEDEQWDIHEMWSTMVNRRYKESTIAYAESHDQAIVGDKTIAFWLMDKEMYFHMKKDDTNIVVDRGLALHKMIRLFTASLGGEGYLNFMGNEFGHPEWVDFPREGNNWSHKYARRQWNLLDDKKLKYQFFNAFDAAMVKLLISNKVVQAPQAKQLNMDDANKVIVFERANLIFVFNFSPYNSIPEYKFFPQQEGTFKIVLNSDNKKFGGHDRIDESLKYPVKDGMLSLYCTNRTALVLKKV